MMDSGPASETHAETGGPPHRRRLRTLAALSVVAGLVGSPELASAQEARKAALADTARITAIDPEQRRITVGEAERAKRFRIEDATEILAGGERVSLTALEVGDRVVVTATEEGAETEGLPIANRIQVVVDDEPGAAVSAAGGAELLVSLRDARGNPVGDARIVDSPNGILIHAAFRDLPPGPHGFHIHETGRCEPSFDAAGGHLAGAGEPQHGFLREAGPHAGDLVNLDVASDGIVTAVVRAPALRLADLEDGDGSALVIHAGPDDYRSQPSGAAGERIACGVIGGDPSSPSPTS